jgi:hypothetical protein
MSRSTAALGMTTLALLFGWGTATAQVPPTPTPTPQVPCQVELGKQAAVSVDGSAAADPDCLTVKRNKTTIVWTGSADVKTLRISFENPATKHPPEDPVCTGAQCVSDKLKLNKLGEFDYGIVVVRQDGTTARVDPKVIIQP